MKLHARLKTVVRNESGFGLVETLIALTILVVGLVAVTGLSLASADQARIANWHSQQSTAAQMVMEDIEMAGWWGASSGVDTVSVSGHDIAVTTAISDVSKRVRQVTIVVSGIGDADTAVYRTRLYKPLPLPDPPPGP